MRDAPPTSLAEPSGTGEPDWKRRALFIAPVLVVGTGAAIAVSQLAGADQVLESLSGMWPALAMVAFAEGLRVGAEAACFRGLLADNARQRTRDAEPSPPAPVPWVQLMKAQLLAYSISSVLPAGRLAAEGARAALLAPYVGIAATSAAATVVQSLHLVTTRLWSFAASAFLFAIGAPRWLSLGLVVIGLGTAAAGLGVMMLARSGNMPPVLARRFPRLASAVAIYRASVGDLGKRPLPVFGWLCLSRCLQVAQFGALLATLGPPSVLSSLTASAVHLFAISAGDLIPGQLGVTDGAFAACADLLGVAPSDGVAIALGLHAVQLGFTVTGVVTYAVFSATRRQVDTRAAVSVTARPAS